MRIKIEFAVAGIVHESRFFRSSAQAWQWACRKRPEGGDACRVMIDGRWLSLDQTVTWNRLRYVYRNAKGARKRDAWLEAERMLRPVEVAPPSIKGKWAA